MSDPGGDPAITVNRRAVLAAAGTLAVAGVAGCSTSNASSGDPETTTAPEDHDDEGHDDEGHDHGSTLDGPVAEASVTVQSRDDGHHFDPHVVWVETGGTVTWELESGAHTATAYAPENDSARRIPEGADAFASGTLSEVGETFEHTFETEGVYDYYCRPHERAGMIGSVIVGEPDPHDQPGLAEPAADMPSGAQEKITSLNGQVNEALGHTHDEETEDEPDDDHEDDGHHETTESGHGEDDGHHEETESGHDEDDGHHETTESGHHEDDGHHETTESGHHEETESGHDEDDGHHEG